MEQPGSERGNRIGRHYGSNRHSSSFADGLPLLPHGPWPLYGLVEFVCFRGVGYESGAAFFHHFGTSALVGDNSKPAAQHGFDKRQRQTFSARGQNQRVMRLPDRFNVVYKPWKIDILK